MANCCDAVRRRGFRAANTSILREGSLGFTRMGKWGRTREMVLLSCHYNVRKSERRDGGMRDHGFFGIWVSLHVAVRKCWNLC